MFPYVYFHYKRSIMVKNFCRPMFFVLFCKDLNKFPIIFMSRSFFYSSTRYVGCLTIFQGKIHVERAVPFWPFYCWTTNSSLKVFWKRTSWSSQCLNHPQWSRLNVWPAREWTKLPSSFQFCGFSSILQSFQLNKFRVIWRPIWLKLWFPGQHIN